MGYRRQIPPPHPPRHRALTFLSPPHCCTCSIASPSSSSSNSTCVSLLLYFPWSYCRKLLLPPAANVVLQLLLLRQQQQRASGIGRQLSYYTHTKTLSLSPSLSLSLCCNWGKLCLRKENLCCCPFSAETSFFFLLPSSGRAPFLFFCGAARFPSIYRGFRCWTNVQKASFFRVDIPLRNRPRRRFFFFFFPSSLRERARPKPFTTLTK